MALKYFDVWEVDMVEATMRSYVEDQHGRIVSDVGPWEPVRYGLYDVALRLTAHGFATGSQHRSTVDRWYRAYKGA